LPSKRNFVIAQPQWDFGTRSDVGFVPKADILACQRDVRFAGTTLFNGLVREAQSKKGRAVHLTSAARRKRTVIRLGDVGRPF
jgi:hypothetical protein